ncbi:MAG: tetratricopeptide repeat protein [Thermodesulfobacteriota bacterium]
MIKQAVRTRGVGCRGAVFGFMAVMLLFLAGPARAEDVQSVCLSMDIFSPVERPFFEDLADGTLADYDYYDAFLIASGIVDRRFSLYRQRIRSLRNRCLAGVDKTAAPYDRGKALLIWLHDNALRTYAEKSNLAGDLLDKGEFNCLSATILYCLLGKDLGLSVSGVLTPGHTFCLVSDGERQVVVETTNRYGFDPGRVEEEPVEGGIRQVTVPRVDYTETTVVPLHGLMALLYVNTLDLATLVVGENETACLPRFAKACLFDPGNDVFANNLSACLNNLAVSALEQDKPAAAMAYIQQGKALGRSSFDDLDVQYYNQVAQQKAGAGDYNGAIETLATALKNYPGDPVLDNNIAYYYGRWADTFKARSDTGGVVRVYLAARQMLPDSAPILESLKTAFYNHAAAAYNRRDFDAARTVCQEALGIFPDEPAFLEILKAIPANPPAWQWGQPPPAPQQ